MGILSLSFPAEINPWVGFLPSTPPCSSVPPSQIDPNLVVDNALMADLADFTVDRTNEYPYGSSSCPSDDEDAMIVGLDQRGKEL